MDTRRDGSGGKRRDVEEEVDRVIEMSRRVRVWCVWSTQFYALTRLQSDVGMTETNLGFAQEM